MLAAAPRAKNICSSLPPRQVRSSWAGLLCGDALARQPHAARGTPRFGASPFLRGALGCCDCFSEPPKEDALSCVSDAKCALEFNSCYSAIITHFVEYLVTMAGALVIRFGLLLLLSFKDLSAKHFLPSLRIAYFSIFSPQR